MQGSEISAKLRNKIQPLLLLLFLLKIPYGLNAQNLVADPSFEAYKRCPCGISNINLSVYWFSINTATPDLFNACCNSKNHSSVPKNMCGKQNPVTGNGYAGIVLFENSMYDYKEYLATKLIQPLQKDKSYKISFYCSLTEHSVYSLKEIHAAFSIRKPFSKEYITWQPDTFLTHTNEKALSNTNKWHYVSFNYVAKGGEQYLSIGNFKNDRLTKIVRKRKEKVDAQSYYFIEDVSVLSDEHDFNIESLPSVHDNSRADTLKEGQIIVLENIYFDTDQAILKPKSYSSLNKLTDLLYSHPSMEIEIRGHTDNQASDEHNLKLSEHRAKAVFNYLVNQGIDPKRLEYKGYGYHLPISDNSTEQGREKNRRVEFRIIRL